MDRVALLIAVIHVFMIFIWLPTHHMAHGDIFPSSVAETLYDKLTTGYYKTVRPGIGRGTPMLLNLTFHLVALNYLDEVHGEMNSMGYLTMKWVDPRLVWNPHEYAGMTTILMPFDKIWTPEILVGNPSQKITKLNSDSTMPRLQYNGVVMWMPGEVFQTRCSPDIYKYPFDEQECHISFVPWGYLPNEIQLNVPDNNNPTPFYEDNGEWILNEMSTKFYIENSLGVAKFFYRFKRRYQFVVVNIIVPILLLGFLNCFVFLIPANSGERISFSITVFLSFAVFMSLVADTIPQTSDPMAFILYYLLSVFTMSFLITLFTILNCRMYNRDPNIPVSGAYKTLVRWTSNKRSKQKVFPERGNDHNNADKTYDDDNADGNDSPDPATDISWTDVSQCLDTLCGLGFLLLFTISSLAQLLVISTSP